MDVTLYVILNWDRFFENAASRKLHHLAWFACPTKQDGEGYQDLHENHDDGTAHFGAFQAILELAAKTQPREARWSGCLIKNDGTPHDARSLSRKTHVRKEIIQAALDRLVAEIGWVGKVLVDSQRLMDTYRNKPKELPTLVAESANAVAGAPTGVADDRQSNHATGTTGKTCNTEKDGSPPIVPPTERNPEGEPPKKRTPSPGRGKKKVSPPAGEKDPLAGAASTLTKHLFDETDRVLGRKPRWNYGLAVKGARDVFRGIDGEALTAELDQAKLDITFWLEERNGDGTLPRSRYDMWTFKEQVDAIRRRRKGEAVIGGQRKDQAGSGRGGEAARGRRAEKTAREGGAQRYIDPV